MPALAVGQALVDLDPTVNLRYVCGQREEELALYAAAGVTPQAFPVRPIRPGLSGHWTAGLALVAAVWRARRLIQTLRPRVILGMGGYVAAPACLAGLAARVPVVIHEQNAILGRANRWLARWVWRVAGAFDELAGATPPGRFVRTGIPVRPTIGTVDRDAGARRFQLDPGRPIIAVTGGSQGAQSLNRFIARALPALAEAADRCGRPQLLWACGRNRYEECLREAPEAARERLSARLTPYVEDMDCFLAAADIIIARAGASTLAETMLCGKPTIVFPLRSAIYDHQRLNAQALVRAGAALMLSEYEDAPATLADTVAGLLQDPDRLTAMGQAARALAAPHAARDLATLLMEAMETP